MFIGTSYCSSILFFFHSLFSHDFLQRHNLFNVKFENFFKMPLSYDGGDNHFSAPLSPSCALTHQQDLSLSVGSLEFTSHFSTTLIGWLIIYGFTSRWRIFHLYGDVIIAGEGLQNLGLCLVLRAFECSGPLSRGGGSFSYYTYCDTGPRFFWSHPKDCPIQSPLTTHEGMWRTYSNADPHRVLYYIYM
jgi:hypothetical protein